MSLPPDYTERADLGLELDELKKHPLVRSALRNNHRTVNALKELTPQAQAAVLAILLEGKRRGLPQIVVVDAGRTPEEQEAHRKAGRSKAKGGKGAHNVGQGWDIAFGDGMGRVTQDGLSYKKHKKDFDEYVNILRDLGLRTGPLELGDFGHGEVPPKEWSLYGEEAYQWLRKRRDLRNPEANLTLKERQKLREEIAEHEKAVLAEGGKLPPEEDSGKRLQEALKGLPIPAPVLTRNTITGRGDGPIPGAEPPVQPAVSAQPAPPQITLPGLGPVISQNPIIGSQLGGAATQTARPQEEVLPPPPPRSQVVRASGPPTQPTHRNYPAASHGDRILPPPTEEPPMPLPEPEIAASPAPGVADAMPVPEEEDFGPQQDLAQTFDPFGTQNASASAPAQQVTFDPRRSIFDQPEPEQPPPSLAEAFDPFGASAVSQNPLMESQFRRPIGETLKHMGIELAVDHMEPRTMMALIASFGTWGLGGRVAASVLGRIGYRPILGAAGEVTGFLKAMSTTLPSGAQQFTRSHVARLFHRASQGFFASLPFAISEGFMEEPEEGETHLGRFSNEIMIFEAFDLAFMALGGGFNAVTRRWAMRKLLENRAAGLETFRSIVENAREAFAEGGTAASKEQVLGAAITEALYNRIEGLEEIIGPGNTEAFLVALEQLSRAGPTAKLNVFESSVMDDLVNNREFVVGMEQLGVVGEDLRQTVQDIGVIFRDAVHAKTLSETARLAVVNHERSGMFNRIASRMRPEIAEVTEKVTKEIKDPLSGKVTQHTTTERVRRFTGQWHIVYKNRKGETVTGTLLVNDKGTWRRAKSSKFRKSPWDEAFASDEERDIAQNIVNRLNARAGHSVEGGSARAGEEAIFPDEPGLLTAWEERYLGKTPPPERSAFETPFGELVDDEFVQQLSPAEARLRDLMRAQANAEPHQLETYDEFVARAPEEARSFLEEIDRALGGMDSNDPAYKFLRIEQAGMRRALGIESASASPALMTSLESPVSFKVGQKISIGKANGTIEEVHPTITGVLNRPNEYTVKMDNGTTRRVSEAAINPTRQELRGAAKAAAEAKAAKPQPLPKTEAHAMKDLAVRLSNLRNTGPKALEKLDDAGKQLFFQRRFDAAPNKAAKEALAVKFKGFEKWFPEGQKPKATPPPTESKVPLGDLAPETPKTSPSTPTFNTKRGAGKAAPPEESGAFGSLEERHAALRKASVDYDSLVAAIPKIAEDLNTPLDKLTNADVRNYFTSRGLAAPHHMSIRKALGAQGKMASPAKAEGPKFTLSRRKVEGMEFNEVAPGTYETLDKAYTVESVIPEGENKKVWYWKKSDAKAPDDFYPTRKEAVDNLKKFISGEEAPKKPPIPAPGEPMTEEFKTNVRLRTMFNTLASGTQVEQILRKYDYEFFRKQMSKTSHSDEEIRALYEMLLKHFGITK